MNKKYMKGALGVNCEGRGVPSSSLIRPSLTTSAPVYIGLRKIATLLHYITNSQQNKKKKKITLKLTYHKPKQTSRLPPPQKKKRRKTSRSG